jgi:hypothetical protein
VATIEMRIDAVVMGRYSLIWTERDEVVGNVEQSLTGGCQVVPVGPHWSPMKSFARTYENPDLALEDIRQYFARR